jgi:PAS domain S-box-containing protein/putative nucleotidyltransferase with HDIG domain
MPETALKIKLNEEVARLFDLVPHAVAINRGEKRIYANPVYAQLFGYADAAELLNFSILKQIAPQCRDQILERMHRIEDGETVPDIYETIGQRRDGTQMPLRMHVGHIQLEDGPAEIAFVSDTTEYKTAQDKIQHQASFPQLAPMPIIEVNFASEIVYHNPATEATMNNLGVTNLTAFLPSDLPNLLSALELADRGSFYREVAVADRIFAENIFLTWEFRTIRIYAYDITERMWALRELKKSEENYRELIENLGEGVGILDPDERFVFTNPAFDLIFGVQTGELIGQQLGEFTTPETLKMVQQETERRSRGERGTYEMEIINPDGRKRQIQVSATPKFAGGKFIGALAIIHDITDRKLALEELTQSYQRLNRAMDQTINALATTVGKRDPYTSNHQQRVTQLVIAIARELGLSENQIAGIRVAGILHDIGKIYVPSEILSKPTKLTEAEFNIIRTHSQAGFEILMGVEFPWPIAQIVLQHHERLDGSGYPQGLRSDQILLEAKILTVADVVEALSSDRPYRPAFGIDFALNEVANNKNKFYDPTVVDACLNIFLQKKFKFE